MNDFLQDVLDIKLSNKVPDRKIRKQSKVSSVEFADGEEVAQDFGKQEHQGKPVSDPQTFDKAKGEFADGKEVKVEDFKASSKKVKTSSDDIKITNDELVLMDGDGKILSVVDDQHVDFLDTVDDPDGGYERAVKFDSYRDAHQALWNMYGEDIPEDIVTVKAKDAFAFVEDSKCKKIKNSETEFAIYFDDLTDGAQKAILKAAGISDPAEANWDAFPITTLNFEVDI